MQSKVDIRPAQLNLQAKMAWFARQALAKTRLQRLPGTPGRGAVSIQCDPLQPMAIASHRPLLNRTKRASPLIAALGTGAKPERLKGLGGLTLAAFGGPIPRGGQILLQRGLHLSRFHLPAAGSHRDHSRQKNKP